MPKRKPHRWLKGPRRLVQHHIGEEHPAYPDHGGKDMERFFASILSESGYEVTLTGIDQVLAYQLGLLCA